MHADGNHAEYRRSGNRSDLVELWQANKQDRQRHASMLREVLEKEKHK
jgi:hypothetical protein